jgi:hypothetical protein
MVAQLHFAPPRAHRAPDGHLEGRVAGQRLERVASEEIDQERVAPRLGGARLVPRRFVAVAAPIRPVWASTAVPIGMPFQWVTSTPGGRSFAYSAPASATT